MAAAPLRFPNRKFKKLGTESFPQEPNGDLAFLHSSGGGLIDSQPTKLQPYPTLKSPAHPTTLYPYQEGKKLGQEEEVEMEMEMEEEEEEVEMEEEEEEWIESEEVEMDPAQREKIRAAQKAAHDAAMPEMMKIVADACERARKVSLRPPPPPLEMLDYPDLFEKAWGWDMLLPMRATNPWSKYKEYLSAYYNHNIKEANADGDADDDGNDLKSQARSCIKMEGHLLFLWNKYATLFPNADHEIRQVSDKVTKHALEMVDALEAEFPAAAVSLKCITKEAELMCGWILSEGASPISYIRVSNEIRKCALSFMFYKKPEPKYVSAMAAMMGIMEEAKVVYWFLWNLEIKHGNVPMSLVSREGTLGVMLDISDECFAVEDSTGGSTAGEHISSESDVNNFSDKLGDTSNDVNFSMTGMAEQGSLVEMNGTRITKIGSEMEGVKKDDTVGRSNGEEPILVQKKNVVQKDDEQERDNYINRSTKIGSEMGNVKRYNIMERNEKQKLQVLLGLDSDESDEVFVGENISYVEADKESNKNDDGSTK